MSDEITGLSLYKIENELRELIELRETMEAEGELPESLAVLDNQINSYFVAEVRKVDGIASYIHHGNAQAALAKAEVDRLLCWVKRWENRMARVKAATIYALHAVGLKKVEGKYNRLRLQRNPASVEVYEVASLPDEFMKATITMPLAVWKEMHALYANYHPGDLEVLRDGTLRITGDVDKRAIAEALKRGEEVPGARWAPETEHLRCE